MLQLICSDCKEVMSHMACGLKVISLQQTGDLLITEVINIFDSSNFSILMLWH